MVLRPFHRRRCPFLLVLSTRHPIQSRSFPIQELHGTFRADAAAAERAKTAGLRARGADWVRPGRLITRAAFGKPGESERLGAALLQAPISERGGSMRETKPGRAHLIAGGFPPGS